MGAERRGRRVSDLRHLGIASHPNVNAGAPSFSGIRVVDLLDRIDAGDSIPEVAEDFGVEAGSLELLVELRDSLESSPSPTQPAVREAT